MAIISYISLYIYEHPHHHCPFCILKSGHDYAGYALYMPLFLATAIALAAGVISLWRKVPSLGAAVETVAPRLTFIALSLFAIFYAMATWLVLRSNLTMESVWW